MFTSISRDIGIAVRVLRMVDRNVLLEGCTTSVVKRRCLQQSCLDAMGVPRRKVLPFWNYF